MSKIYERIAFKDLRPGMLVNTWQYGWVTVKAVSNQSGHTFIGFVDSGSVKLASAGGDTEIEVLRTEDGWKLGPANMHDRQFANDLQMAMEEASEIVSNATHRVDMSSTTKFSNSLLNHQHRVLNFLQSALSEISEEFKDATHPVRKDPTNE